MIEPDVPQFSRSSTEGVNPYQSPAIADDLPHELYGGPPLNPWISIWTKPRATIRQIVNTNPTYMVIPLVALGGISQVLDNASTRSLGDRTPIAVIIAGALFIGPLSGVLGLYVAGWLLRVVGGWLGGVASTLQVRAAVAWGQLPGLYASVLWIPNLLVFREEAFTSATPRLDSNPSLLIVLLSIALVEVVCGIWSMVVTCKCLGEVHRFSAWVAFGSVLLAGLLVLIVLIVPLIAIIAIAVM